MDIKIYRVATLPMVLRHGRFAANFRWAFFVFVVIGGLEANYDKKDLLTSLHHLMRIAVFLSLVISKVVIVVGRLTLVGPFGQVKAARQKSSRIGNASLNIYMVGFL